MKAQRSGDNPFGHDRSAFAWEQVPVGTPAHLDFGCYEGRFLASLQRKKVRRLVGVDACREALDAGQKRCPSLELVHMTKTVPLPFGDQEFNSVSLMDVIEHVSEQTALLDELHRVLRDDGVLIITVPGKHFFSFLDIGNFKFRFPRLHRWAYCLRHSRQEYEYRYVSNPDGLMGDISANVKWHQHYAAKDLETLLSKSGFVPVCFDGCGFFNRPIVLIEIFLQWLPPARKLFRRLKLWDDRCFESMNLFCVARKAPMR